MSAPGSPIRVLVADDDAILREIAGAMLRDAGFTVQTVASGDAAVAACALCLPDIALLDVEMPDGNGHQACTNIRSLPGGADLPIVMVTGCDDTASIDRAYEAGATDFVVKPINWALLVHRIRYVLRGARTLVDLRFSEQKNAALLKAIPDGIFLSTRRRAASSRCVSSSSFLWHGARLRWIALTPRCAAKRRCSSFPWMSNRDRIATSNAAICRIPAVRYW
jgi:DNA-binding response OmpR family regulator